MRFIQTIALIGASLAICGVAAAQSSSVALDIKPQPMRAALRDLGAQTGLQILFRAEDVARGKPAPAVSGNLSAQEALDRLLANTGLKYEFVNEHTVRISSAQPKTISTTAVDPSGDPDASPSVRANQGLAPGSSTISDDNQNSANYQSNGTELTEIIVTAQKKSERLQDVPVPVTVLNADVLADNNQVLLRDYYTKIPGFVVSPNYVSTQTISIRGITSGGLTSPTVGVLIDEVPFGSSAGMPDIDPGDLARIEVLRGPQGALYGANGMGGLLKYVTADPSVEGFSGRLEAGANHVQNGDKLGYDFRGSVNAPISDTFAIRMSAFERHDAGYIDNPLYGLEGVNAEKSYGGRLSALWRPSQNISLKISALYQNTEKDGLDEVVVPTVGYPSTATLKGLQQNYFPGSGVADKPFQAYGATLNMKLGIVDLTSVSGYSAQKGANALDFSWALGGPGGLSDEAFHVPIAIYKAISTFSQVTQELRASMPISDKAEWRFGAFYSRQNQGDGKVFVDAVNPETSQVVGNLYTFANVNGTGITEEVAGFTDLMYHFTDRFDVEMGGRQSYDRVVTPATITTGPYTTFIFQVDSIPAPALKSNDHAFTYLLTPRFKISSDLMVYARFASGYRPGGANSAGVGVPPQFGPDKTENYEVGFKGDFFANTLSIDASVYHIDWKNIQLQFIDKSTDQTYGGNGSGAKSEGVELSVTSRPLTGLTVSGWVSYDNAVLTKPFINVANTVGNAGDQLPNTPRLSGYLSLEQSFPLSSSLTGFVAGAVSYVGDRKSVFLGDDADGITPSARQDFPGYTKVDLRAGLKYESWTANFFVNNVADRRGVLDGGAGYFYTPAFFYIPPRTVGISVAKTF